MANHRHVPSRHLSVTESVALPPNQGSVLCSIVRFPRFFMENPLEASVLCGLRVSDDPFAP
jgi:hypothetical protein